MDRLPRRASLGLRLGPDHEAFVAGGVRTAGSLLGSSAAEAGIVSGDVVTSVSGMPVASPCALGAALRRAGTERVTTIEWRHGDSLGAEWERRAHVEVRAAPIETVPGQDVELGEVMADGLALRTIFTAPALAAPLPAVLLVPGITCASIDFGPGVVDEPVARLVHALASRGFATMRVDKPGIGDSEGCCEDVSFATELRGYAAAYEAMACDHRVDRTRLFVFGHSVGGRVASFIATEPRSPPPRGVVVSGACARSWYESLETSARRQLLLRGIAPERVERRLAKRRSMLGAWPVGGRSARYHRELEAFDVAARWRRVTCPVRILAAEHDWIVTPQEQTTIESLLSDRSPPHVDRVDLPGLDHVFTRHPSLAASVTQYGAGEPDSGWTEHVTEWLGSP